MTPPAWPAFLATFGVRTVHYLYAFIIVRTGNTSTFGFLYIIHGSAGPITELLQRRWTREVQTQKRKIAAWTAAVGGVKANLSEFFMTSLRGKGRIKNNARLSNAALSKIAQRGVRNRRISVDVGDAS